MTRGVEKPLPLWKCKSEKCDATMRCLGSQVSHRCQWNRNRLTEFVKVDEDEARIPLGSFQ